MKHYILIDEYGSLLIDFNQNKEVAEHWQKLFDGSRIEYTDFNFMPTCRAIGRKEVNYE